HAFGSYQHFINPAHGARNMSALAVHHRTIGISEFYIVMVKNFPMILALAHLAATHTLGFYRIRALKPVHHINIMNMLLGNMIAAKPVEIIPVTHLVFHFRLSVFALV